MNHNDGLPVYSCTLATLNELTRKRYESAGHESISQIEVFEPFDSISLEGTISRCKQALLAKARKIDISAIVVEATYTYTTTEHIMGPTLYATGIAVTDCTGKPHFA